MTTDTIYKPDYTNSWALVIGINNYQKASPLNYACNDANAVADILIKQFNFSKSNVTLLLDDEATFEGIRKSFLTYTKEDIGADDRLFVFFAGHGHTVTGKRGDIGFLVPVDGTSDDLSTLIRWDELTRNADLIRAKHVLFIMDACYGGLAVKRSLPSGSMRFVKDMLQRYSRQVLTAGKADEPVADAGGPKNGHSIFTGHLLEALEGKAKTKNGIITANHVMAYVYDKVAKDQYSQQTPHYGFIEGDGDFIFDISPIAEILEPSGEDKDILAELPPSLDVPSTTAIQPSLEDQVKEFLSTPQNKIRLDDLTTKIVKKAIYNLSVKNFPVEPTSVSTEEFSGILKRYEHEVTDLQKIIILLAKWGGEEHRLLLKKIFARLVEINSHEGGQESLLGLRWFPIHLLLYSGGIAALASENYTNLATILTTPVQVGHTTNISQAIVISTTRNIQKYMLPEKMKQLPGHERQYVPLSEYTFKVLQPPLDDLLFMGRDYESLFDRFEILYCLVYADLTCDDDCVWGPPGRFSWKHKSISRATSPFSVIVKEASILKDNWPPIVNGLFQGSYARFAKIAEGYDEFLKQLPWF